MGWLSPPDQAIGVAGLSVAARLAGALPSGPATTMAAPPWPSGRTSAIEPLTVEMATAATGPPSRVRLPSAPTRTRASLSPGAGDCPGAAVAAGVGRSGTAREGTAGRLGPPADGLGRALGEGLGVGGGEDAAVTTTEPSAPATTEG